MTVKSGDTHIRNFAVTDNDLHNQKHLRHKGVNTPPPPPFLLSEFSAKPDGVTFRMFAPPPGSTYTSA